MTMTDPGAAKRGPRINQAVHYRSYGTPGNEYGPACRAAIVTEVGAWVADGPPAVSDDGAHRTVPQRWDPEACSLFVANPTGMFLNGPVARHEPPVEMITRGDGSDTPGRLYRGGTWHALPGCSA